MTRWWIWDQPTCCRIPLSMITSLQQTRNFKLKSEQAFWDIMVISTCHVIHPFLRSHWKRKNKNPGRHKRCWVWMSPWNTRMGCDRQTTRWEPSPTNKLLKETTCNRTPHPLNMSFYISPLRPPISGNTSQPAKGVWMRVYCLLENKRREDREKEPQRIGTRVAVFTHLGRPINWSKLYE